VKKAGKGNGKGDGVELKIRVEPGDFWILLMTSGEAKKRGT